MFSACGGDTQTVAELETHAEKVCEAVNDYEGAENRCKNSTYNPICAWDGEWCEAK